MRITCRYLNECSYFNTSNHWRRSIRMQNDAWSAYSSTVSRWFRNMSLSILGLLSIFLYFFLVWLPWRLFNCIEYSLCLHSSCVWCMWVVISEFGYVVKMGICCCCIIWNNTFPVSTVSFNLIVLTMYW